METFQEWFHIHIGGNPETHRKGHARAATMGLMTGAVVMLYLDVTLG